MAEDKAMNAKRKNGAKIRGWFPREPVMLSIEKSSKRKIPYMMPWLTVAAAVGLAVAALLVVVGGILGFTTGYAAYFWYLAVALIAWDIGGFVAVGAYCKHKTAIEKEQT